MSETVLNEPEAIPETSREREQWGDRYERARQQRTGGEREQASG